MPNTQEFGIIEDIKKKKTYVEYEPKRYDCIFIDDDFFTEIYMRNIKNFENIETFSYDLNHNHKGLELCGVTLIPPKSLKQFLDIICYENNKCSSRELTLLIEKISIAIKENKYLIHYGL